MCLGLDHREMVTFLTEPPAQAFPDQVAIVPGDADPFLFVVTHPVPSPPLLSQELWQILPESFLGTAYRWGYVGGDLWG
jgi:hypothetical protein